MRGRNQSYTADQAEALALYAEYAIDFATQAMRQALIYEQTPQRKMLLIWFGVSIFLAAWGIRRIYREENSYVKVI